MQIIDSSIAREKPQHWGSIKVLFSDPKTNAEVGLFKCLAGKSMDMHTHPMCDELIFVLDGKAGFEDEEGTKEGEEGAAVLIPRNAMHRAFNKTSRDCQCLYVVANLR